MKRLTLHLKDQMDGLHTTRSFIVNNDKDIAHHLSMYSDKITKHYTTNLI